MHQVIMALFITPWSSIGAADGSRTDSMVTVKDEQTLTIPIEGLQSFRIETISGDITVVGRREPAQSITVRVRRDARGPTQEAARQCLQALKIGSEKKDATHGLNWTWTEGPRPDWQAAVHFDVQMPPNLTLEAIGHNGKVTVGGLSGEVRLENQNGGIEAVTTSRKLSVKTQNGPLKIVGQPEHLIATAQNGPVDVTFSGPTRVQGEVSTHNGPITLTMNDAAATFDCRTGLGGIQCSLKLHGVKITQNALTGTLGEATGTLKVETRIGPITLK